MSDYQLGATIYKKFTTRDSDGAPATLGGTPVVSVYEENNATQITAGVTLTTDYDSVTGLNQVAIVATGGNGYEAGKDYAAVITTGTVDGGSVVGEVIENFSIEKSALADGAITADKIASNAIAAAKIASNAITSAKIATDAIGSSELADAAATEIATAVWASGTRVLTGNTNLNDLDAAGIRAAVGLTSADLDTQLSTIAAYIDTEIAAILADTGTTLDAKLNAIQAVTDNLPDSGALSSLATAAALAAVAGNVSSILEDTGTTIPGILGTPADSDLATDIANVQTEVDKFDDAQAEPTGVPSATASPLAKLGVLYMMLCNGVTITADKKTFHDSAGNPEFEKDVSDDDTTFTESRVNSV